MSKRKTKVMPSFPGIYQIQVWDVDVKKWTEPKFGAKYMVARPGKDDTGRFKREWGCFDTFAEAKAYRNRSVVEVKQTPAPATGTSLGQLMELWKQNWLSHKQPTTQIRYASYLQHFQFLKEMPVEAIKPIHVDQWIAHVKRPEYLGRHHSTRCNYRHEFSVLKSILGYYVERLNHDYRLPFVRSHLAEKPEQKKDLSVDQIKLFLDALCIDVKDTKYEAIYYVAAMQYFIWASAGGRSSALRGFRLRGEENPRPAQGAMDA